MMRENRTWQQSNPVPPEKCSSFRPDKSALTHRHFLLIERTKQWAVTAQHAQNQTGPPINFDSLFALRKPIPLGVFGPAAVRNTSLSFRSHNEQVSPDCTIDKQAGFEIRELTPG